MEGHISTVRELNEIVREGRLAQLIGVDETRHTERIVRIAERIAAHVPKSRLVLLAGPSSAGKTTTAMRLCRRLRENGLSPLHLSTDDYFVGDARNPRNPDGTLDYETVKAVDAERLAADLSALFENRPVRLRKFDFLKKDGFDAPEETVSDANGIVVLEGIHALNPELTPGVPEALKFRVYVNVFTQLSLEGHDAFYPEDSRLLRRIVRDADYRNEAPASTLARWPSVEAGEHKWIDPFRGLADAVFNTALDYELAVLKPMALDLLRSVDGDDPSFREADRLASVLATVQEAPSEGVPANSILRETIGGSQFDYV